MVVMHIAYARAQIFAFDTQYFTFEKKKYSKCWNRFNDENKTVKAERTDEKQKETLFFLMNLLHLIL